MWFILRIGRFTTSITECDTKPYFDVMAISGFLSCLSGCLIATLTEGRYLKVKAQLIADGIIDPYHGSVIQRYVSHNQWKWRRRSRLFILVVAAVGNIAALGNEISFEFGLGVTLCGAVLGDRLGSLAGHGTFTQYFRKRPNSLRLIPDHPDNAGGSAGLGSFILFSGLLISIIIVWLIYWLFNLSSFEVRCTDFLYEYSTLNYEQYTWFFYILLVVCSAFMYFSVVRPILDMRPMMKSAKRTMADVYAGNSPVRTFELVDDLYDRNSDEAFQTRLDKIRQRISIQNKIARLPEFPLSTLALQAFRVSRLTPLLSVLIGMIPLSDPMPGMLSDFIEELLKGL
nr:hypothetical protein [uncultured Hyphomonas sp.]